MSVFSLGPNLTDKSFFLNAAKSNGLSEDDAEDMYMEHVVETMRSLPNLDPSFDMALSDAPVEPSYISGEYAKEIKKKLFGKESAIDKLKSSTGDDDDSSLLSSLVQYISKPQEDEFTGMFDPVEDPQSFSFTNALTRSLHNNAGFISAMAGLGLNYTGKKLEEFTGRSLKNGENLEMLGQPLLEWANARFEDAEAIEQAESTIGWLGEAAVELIPTIVMTAGAGALAKSGAQSLVGAGVKKTVKEQLLKKLTAEIGEESAKKFVTDKLVTGLTAGVSRSAFLKKGRKNGQELLKNNLKKAGLSDMVKITGKDQVKDLTAEIIAPTVGTTVASYVINSGSIYSELHKIAEEQGREVTLGDVSTMGMASALIEALPGMYFLEKFGIAGRVGTLAKAMKTPQGAKAMSALKRVSLETVKGSAVEGPTEMLQGVMSEIAKGQYINNWDKIPEEEKVDLLRYIMRPEARERYLLELAAGTALGGVIGGTTSTIKGAEATTQDTDADLAKQKEFLEKNFHLQPALGSHHDPVAKERRAAQDEALFNALDQDKAKDKAIKEREESETQAMRSRLQQVLQNVKGKKSADIDTDLRRMEQDEALFEVLDRERAEKEKYEAEFAELEAQEEARASELRDEFFRNNQAKRKDDAAADAYVERELVRERKLANFQKEKAKVVAGKKRRAKEFENLRQDQAARDLDADPIIAQQDTDANLARFLAGELDEDAAHIQSELKKGKLSDAQARSLTEAIAAERAGLEAEFDVLASQDKEAVLSQTQSKEFDAQVGEENVFQDRELRQDRLEDLKDERAVRQDQGIDPAQPDPGTLLEDVHIRDAQTPQGREYRGLEATLERTVGRMKATGSKRLQEKLQDEARGLRKRMAGLEEAFELTQRDKEISRGDAILPRDNDQEMAKLQKAVAQEPIVAPVDEAVDTDIQSEETVEVQETPVLDEIANETQAETTQVVDEDVDMEAIMAQFDQPVGDLNSETALDPETQAQVQQDESVEATVEQEQRIDPAQDAEAALETSAPPVDTGTELVKAADRYKRSKSESDKASYEAAIQAHSEATGKDLSTPEARTAELNEQLDNNEKLERATSEDLLVDLDRWSLETGLDQEGKPLTVYQILEAIPKQLSSKIKFVVANSNAIDTDKQWRGAFRGEENTVYLNIDQLTDDTLVDTIFHEAVGHALARKVLGMKEFSNLINQIAVDMERILRTKGDMTLPSGAKLSDIVANYKDKGEAVMAEEVWANYVGGHAKQMFTDRSLLARIFTKIKNLINKMRGKEFAYLDQKAMDLIDSIMVGNATFNGDGLMQNVQQTSGVVTSPDIMFSLADANPSDTKAYMKYFGAMADKLSKIPVIDSFIKRDETSITDAERWLRTKQWLVKKHKDLQSMWDAQMRASRASSDEMFELGEMLKPYMNNRNVDDRKAVDALLVKGDINGIEYTSPRHAGLTDTQFEMYKSFRDVLNTSASRQIKVLQQVKQEALERQAEALQKKGELSAEVASAMAKRKALLKDSKADTVAERKALANALADLAPAIKALTTANADLNTTVKEINQTITSLNQVGYIPRIRKGDKDIKYFNKKERKEYRISSGKTGRDSEVWTRDKLAELRSNPDIDQESIVEMFVDREPSADDNNPSAIQIEQYLGMSLKDAPAEMQNAVKMLIQAKGFRKHFLRRTKKDIEPSYSGTDEQAVVHGYQTENLHEVITDYMQGDVFGRHKREAAKNMVEVFRNSELSGKKRGTTEAKIAQDILGNINHKQTAWDQLANMASATAYNMWIAGRLSSAMWNTTHLHMFGAGLLRTTLNKAGNFKTKSLPALSGRMFSAHTAAMKYQRARYSNDGQPVDTVDGLSADDVAFFNKIYSTVSHQTLTEESIQRTFDNDRTPFRRMMGGRWKSAQRIASIPMQQTELANRLGASLAHARETGFADTDASLSFTDDLNAVYSKSNVPKWAEHGGVRALGYQFGTHVQNTYEMMGHMLKHDKGAFGYSMMTMLMIGGMPAKAAAEGIWKLIYGTDMNKDLRGTFLGETGTDLLTKGAISKLTGIDVSGSLSMGTPPIANLVAQFTGTNQEQAAVAPFTSMIKAYKGEQPLYKMMPIKSLQSIGQAFSDSDQVQIGGRRITINGRPMQLTAGEAAMTAFGFTPWRRSVVAETIYTEGEINFSMNRRKSDILKRVQEARGADRIEAIKEIRDFNKKLNALRKIKGYGFLRTKPISSRDLRSKKDRGAKDVQLED